MKSYQNGIKKLWVLNVGALKPLELETEFFLRLAWSAGKSDEIEPAAFVSKWANKNFIEGCGKEIADIYSSYAQITNVCKVEHMKEGLFSHSAYGNEAARRMCRLEKLFKRTNNLYSNIPSNRRDAFFQMFAMRIHSSYFINASFYFADHSTFCFNNNRMRKADKCIVHSRFMDSLKRQMIYYYNKIMSSGKWDHILTPEAYPPPCTALYPCGTPALKITEEDETSTKKIDNKLFTTTDGFAENDGYISILASHYSKCEGWSTIANLGRYEGDCMQADVKNAIITYDFVTQSEGEFQLEVYRFPTLNATGTILLSISIDNNPHFIMKASFCDEKQGDWQKSVMNNVEKLYITLPFLKKGKHTLKLCALDKYVTFSKLVIYTNGFIPSNLGAPESYHKKFNPLPDRKEYSFVPDTVSLTEGMKSMYCCSIKDVPLPDVLYADDDLWKQHWLYTKIKKRPQKNYGASKYIYDENDHKNVFEQFGAGVFCEKNGVLSFGTEYVLEQSKNAYTTGKWTHIQSESNGQTGIAMRSLECASLSYKIKLSEGKYAIWALMKYQDGNPQVSIDLDDCTVPREKMVHNSRYHNGATQEHWVWTLLAQTLISEGTHVLTLNASPDLRLDRIYMTLWDELPPMDCDWNESIRIPFI